MSLFSVSVVPAFTAPKTPVRGIRTNTKHRDSPGGDRPRRKRRFESPPISPRHRPQFSLNVSSAEEGATVKGGLTALPSHEQPPFAPLMARTPAYIRRAHHGLGSAIEAKACPRAMPPSRHDFECQAWRAGYRWVRHDEGVDMARPVGAERTAPALASLDVIHLTTLVETVATQQHRVVMGSSRAVLRVTPSRARLAPPTRACRCRRHRSGDGR